MCPIGQDVRLAIRASCTRHWRELTRGMLHYDDGIHPGLLLDSRVVDVPMSYNPIVVTLPSLKRFFFNGLQ